MCKVKHNNAKRHADSKPHRQLVLKKLESRLLGQNCLDKNEKTTENKGENDVMPPKVLQDCELEGQQSREEYTKDQKEEAAARRTHTGNETTDNATKNKDAIVSEDMLYECDRCVSV